MPWTVRKRKDKYVVINSETGKVKGTHKTRAKAEAQRAALYANVPESRRRKKK